MLRNYFITAWRNLMRNRQTTLINVAGLAFGISCGLVIFLILTFVKSYNTDNKNYDNIYRLVVSTKGADNGYGAGMPSPMPDALRTEVSGIDRLVYISGLYETTLIRYGKDQSDYKYFQENEGVAYTEPLYFTIFTRPIVAGSLHDFNKPKKIVLSEKFAKKYFQDKDPIGQILSINDKDDFEVIAVMKDYPQNSDFPFNLFISYATFKKEHLSYGWGSVSSDDQIYLLLKNTESEKVNSQLPGLVKKYFDEEDAKRLTYFLQPLSEIHSDNRFGNYSHRTFSNTNFLSLLLVGIFLILTACVNFINLSTAVAIKRSREIGIRKVMGSGKGQLIIQFLGETFLVVVFASIISLGLAELLLIKLNTILKMDLHIIFNPVFILFIFLMIVIITMLAGLYPAFVMSGYQPVEALRNLMSRHSSGSMLFRKSLVTTQFFITQLLIIGTGVLLLQMKYIADMDLGFSGEAVINVPVPDCNPEKKHLLKDQLSNVPGVIEVSLNLSTPASGNISITDYSVENNSDKLLSALKPADQNYLSIYNIKLLAGEGLTDSDTLNRVVVNEKWMIQSGFSTPEDVLGAQVTMGSRTIPVVGVVKDFQSLTAREKMQPIMIYSSIHNVRQVTLKVDMSRVKTALAKVKERWSKIFPEYTFDYQFVNDEIASFYESERNMSRIFVFFCLTAIIIGSMGLFGLIAFTTNKKVKEIGVRKVMGASVYQIFALISWDIIRLILIAFVLVVPLSWYIMRTWLQNYTYRIELSPWIFGLGLLVTLVLAWLTIGYRSYIAATANPADSLRSE